MRINLGIRRRLAPLLDNDRRKIELMNALLLSMPGTPVIYYGDEIGMGDNIYLGDRDGVRTPMQWSLDRNGGFSRANPQALYAPPIQDPIFGYQAVNVEAQQQSPGSLLNWMKRLIAVRQGRRTFGRGALTFLYPRNRKVLAYLREFEGETILCVYNLSRNAQACDLDIVGFRDRVPVELLGRTAFPPVTEPSYRLTLPGYGFYWLALPEAGQLASWHQPTPEPLPEFITIVLHDSWRAISESRGGRDLARQVLPGYLPKQTWFKDPAVEGVKLARAGEVRGHHGTYLLAELSVEPDGTTAQCFFLPFAVAWGEGHLAPGAPLLPYTLARVRRGSQVGALYDATHADDFARTLLQLMRAEEELTMGDLMLRSRAGEHRADLEIPIDAAVRRVGAEQSNSLLAVDERILLKVYRRLEAGQHPELELGRFLTDVVGFAHTPRLLGSIEHVAADGTPTALAAAIEFVSNQGDGWHFTLDHLDRALEQIFHMPEGSRPPPTELHELYLAIARLIGRRTAELHYALARGGQDPALAVELFTAADLEAGIATTRAAAAEGLATLERLRPTASDTTVAEIDAALGLWSELDQMLSTPPVLPAGLVKTRCHGDYRLGQILVAKGDVMLIDLEGEALRPLQERRGKALPLTDLAGMLRSFDQAAWASVFRFAEADPMALEQLLAPALEWRDLARAAFLDEYRAGIAGCPSWPGDVEAAAPLRLELATRVLREIVRDAEQRPAWVRGPTRALVELLQRSDELASNASGDADGPDVTILAS
jgi:maltose alpha-D-glucosyltransferase/alpha-amylase